MATTPDDNTLHLITEALQAAVGETCGVMLNIDDAATLIQHLWNRDLVIVEDDLTPNPSPARPGHPEQFATPGTATIHINIDIDPCHARHRKLLQDLGIIPNTSNTHAGNLREEVEDLQTSLGNN